MFYGYIKICPAVLTCTDLGYKGMDSDQIEGIQLGQGQYSCMCQACVLPFGAGKLPFADSFSMTLSAYFSQVCFSLATLNALLSVELMGHFT